MPDYLYHYHRALTIITAWLSPGAANLSETLISTLPRLKYATYLGYITSYSGGTAVQVDFAFICDYAEATNKVNALGIGFDTIMAGQVPVRHPNFFLVMQLRANLVEAGEKNFEIALIDDEGREVLPPLKGKINIPRPPSGTESTGRLSMRFDNVEFPRYGSYSLHVVVEGHEMVRIPLRVLPAPPVPPQQLQ
jgi:hypothetical protein